MKGLRELRDRVVFGSADLDQDWAKLRDTARQCDPMILLDLHMRLMDDTLGSLNEIDRPFVAYLAKLAIRQVAVDVGRMIVDTQEKPL